MTTTEQVMQNVEGESLPTSLVEVKHEAETLSEQCCEIAVESRADYIRGAYLLTCVKAVRKSIAARYGDMVSQAYKSHRAAVAVRRSVDDPLATGESRVKDLMRAFRSSMKEAGESDHKARIETATALAEIARTDRAEALRAEGDARGADAVMAGPLVVAPVPRRDDVPEIDGITYRPRWKAIVHDKAALVGACITNPEWLRLISVNQKELDKLARALRSNLDVPGVSVSEDEDLAVSDMTAGGEDK